MATSSVARFVAARPLLSLLLLADSVLIATNILLWSTGGVPDVLDLHRDGSLPEYFNYLKWLACTLGCAWLFASRREVLYLAWSALFLFFLADDSLRLHEHGGAFLVDWMSLTAALRLRAQDFGELIIWTMAGAVLLGGIAIAYSRSGDREAKAFSRRLLLCVLAFATFAVGIDMLTIMIWPWRTVSAVAGFGEEGGELIVASVTTSVVWQQVRLAPGEAQISGFKV